MTECPKCERPVEQPKTGRPRVFCSVSCRRAGEYEVRRLQRRLESVELEVADYRREVDPELSSRGDLTYTRKLLARAERDLQELEARLRLLLSDARVPREPK